MTSEVRAPLVFTDALTGGFPDVRAPLLLEEALTGGDPDVRTAFVYVEPLTGGNPAVRCPLMLLEVLTPYPEERPLATDLFPSQLGMAWTTHKIPTFVTQVRTATSLRSARNQMTPFPAWDFELSLPFLPSDKAYRSGTVLSDLQTIFGFFFDMGGRAKEWLFRDVQDCQVRGGAIATPDGVTLQWPFVRFLRSTGEPVGQVDLLQKFAFAPGDVNAGADQISHAGHGLKTGDGPVFVANTGGTLPAGLTAQTPYWTIADDANTFRLADDHGDAVAIPPVAVDITGPGSGSHSVTAGWAAYVGGVLQLSGVSLSGPNQLVFASAPMVGAGAITADFDFLFVCHFLADLADAEQFNANLFQMMQIQFRADPA